MTRTMTVGRIDVIDGEPWYVCGTGKRKRYVWTNCSHCGARTPINPNRGTCKNAYCNRLCWSLAYRGANHPQWKGGRWLHKGYVWLSVDGRKVMEHRYVMEKHLGRKLATSEVVHHRNGNPLDNRLENLELTTPSEHVRHHFGEQWRQMRGRRGTKRPPTKSEYVQITDS